VSAPEAHCPGPSACWPLPDTQLLEFCHGHACIGEDAAERSLGHISAWMDGHGGAATVGMTHDVMASRDPRDLEPRSL
jgi:hypothetical protein